MLRRSLDGDEDLLVNNILELTINDDRRLIEAAITYIMIFITIKKTKLETLIKLNNLEKQKRRNRLEDKIKQKEYYGETEELFDPLTKTLNANNEHNQLLSEQTLRAIDWQNQELDKQTKMIQQAGFQIVETASRIGENTSKIDETL